MDAPRMEQPGGDISIPAIIAGATQDQRAASAAKAPDSLCKGKARPRHQRINANACRHRRGFSVPHFGRRQHRS